jgi:hypothetical protein
MLDSLLFLLVLLFKKKINTKRRRFKTFGWKKKEKKKHRAIKFVFSVLRGFHQLNCIADPTCEPDWSSLRFAIWTVRPASPVFKILLETNRVVVFFSFLDARFVNWVVTVFVPARVRKMQALMRHKLKLCNSTFNSLFRLSSSSYFHSYTSPLNSSLPSSTSVSAHSTATNSFTTPWSTIQRRGNRVHASDVRIF